MSDSEQKSDSFAPEKKNMLAETVKGWIAGMAVMLGTMLAFAGIAKSVGGKKASVKDSLLESSSEVMLGGLIGAGINYVKAGRHNDRIEAGSVARRIIKEHEQEKSAREDASHKTDVSRGL